MNVRNVERFPALGFSLCSSVLITFTYRARPAHVTDIYRIIACAVETAWFIYQTQILKIKSILWNVASVSDHLTCEVDLIFSDSYLHGFSPTRKQDRVQTKCTVLVLYFMSVSKICFLFLPLILS